MINILLLEILCRPKFSSALSFSILESFADTLLGCCFASIGVQPLIDKARRNQPVLSTHLGPHKFLKVVKVSREDANDMRNGSHGGLSLQDISGHESIGKRPVGHGKDEPLDFLVRHGPTQNVQHGRDERIGKERHARQGTQNGKNEYLRDQENQVLCRAVGPF